MTIGVLLVTHESLAQALLTIGKKTVGDCTLDIRTLDVPLDSDPELRADRAVQLIRELDSGDGVLILTDLCGSTPSNIACRLSLESEVMVVSGLNLPMLLRVLNYPDLPLAEMAERAVDGGRQGVMLLPRCNEA